MSGIKLSRAELENAIQEIQDIAKETRITVEELDKKTKQAVEAGIQTEWGYQLQEDLKIFNKKQMVDAINLVEERAKKLAGVGDRTTSYDKLGM